MHRVVESRVEDLGGGHDQGRTFLPALHRRLPVGSRCAVFHQESKSRRQGIHAAYYPGFRS